ncbi:CaiB/BaiF CoA transferase family protein [Actinophytocola gossypii]|uniref:CoA transferase n=1 Tax=Actinophytocola gossypii TaxID=2812003 RepID=A0ABT2JDE0_9PSEU|nr:CoA transferase [Actinophytocola gossypii]MCT2585882.1 CoA transferase [Actinophytocola gossypii]
MLQSARVLDLTWVLGGPFGGQLLAQLGAEVIKVEPAGGDPAREIPPHYVGDLSSFFLSVNRGKKSIALDLKTEAGLTAFYDLVRRSDAVLYGFAPDVPERLGIDYERLREINPAIVVGELIGIHDSGPYKRAPAYDLVVQALSGVMSITGAEDGEPARVGYQIADLAGGLYLALGVSGALYSAGRTGRGEKVQVSLLDAQLGLLTWQAQNYFISGEEPRAKGSRSPNIAPSEAFRCRDGRYLAVSPTGASYWRAFCAAMGVPELADDPRFSDRYSRLTNVEQLVEILRPLFLTRDAATWGKHFFDLRIPAAPVLTVSEALDQETARLRDMVEVAEDPRSGEQVSLLGSPVKFDGARQLRYPPRHGADTADVLAELCGYSAERIGEVLVTDPNHEQQREQHDQAE